MASERAYILEVMEKFEKVVVSGQCDKEFILGNYELQ
jgi:hypothetical protein